MRMADVKYFRATNSQTGELGYGSWLSGFEFGYDAGAAAADRERQREIDQLRHALARIYASGRESPCCRRTNSEAALIAWNALNST